ncbi:MAG TPA: hypothetical protein VIH31_02005 [Candidatus Paceibacterota bacterium]
METKLLTETMLFNILAKKYGAGEKRIMKINGYRNLCEIVAVKIFPNSLNIDEKNKASLFFHKDENNFAIIFCSSMPRNSNVDRKLIEIRPSLNGGEPNINFGETSTGSPRVMRLRSSQDEFSMRTRMIAFDIAKDVNYLVYSFSREMGKIPAVKLEKT